MSIHLKFASRMWLVALVWGYPGGPLSAELRARDQPFDYFSNSWALIGLKDYPRGTRISPDHDLLLEGDVRARVLLGEDLEPIPRSVTKTLWRGYLPVVQWVVEDTDGVRYSVRAFAAPLPTPTPAPAPASQGKGEEETRYGWPVDGDNYVNVVQIGVAQGGRPPGREGTDAVPFRSRLPYNSWRAKDRWRWNGSRWPPAWCVVFSRGRLG